MKTCDCLDWRENIDEVNAPLMLQAARSGGKWGGYTGKQFTHCPWCGNPLEMGGHSVSDGNENQISAPGK